MSETLELINEEIERIAKTLKEANTTSDKYEILLDRLDDLLRIKEFFTINE